MNSDPLSMLNAQFGTLTAGLNQQMTELGANCTKMLTQGFTSMNGLAPHNILANLTKGSGYFNALKQKREKGGNVF